MCGPRCRRLNRRITVNLAPTKESGQYDLPIALGILAASGQIPVRALDQYEIPGELALTGELRPVRGALVMAVNMLRSQENKRAFILPQKSASKALLVQNAVVLPAGSLLEVCAHLSGQTELVQQAISRLDLSARAYHRILKVARSITWLARR